MRFLVLCAILLVGCRSTRNASKVDRDIDSDQRIEVESNIDITEAKTENRDVIRYVEEVVETRENQDSTKEEKRTTRTFEIDKSTFEWIVSDKSEIDSVITEHKVDKTKEESIVEVEDSTPRNLRWIGILGICAAVIAVCIVILRLKK